jgi:hypothetical protein
MKDLQCNVPWSMLLRPPSELPSFRYLNEIRTKNEHFSFATLSDI